jgi:hypothetical protein
MHTVVGIEDLSYLKFHRLDFAEKFGLHTARRVIACTRFSNPTLNHWSLL